MSIPKVKFRPMTLEENIETIKWAFYEDNGDFIIILLNIFQNWLQ